jgi:hypothetical protein
MPDIVINGSILKEITSWIEDQVNDFTTIEIRLNFRTNELECYDYEDGIIHSKRPLSYFLS